MPHRDEVEGLVVRGKGEDSLDLVIVEGADGHRPQVQSYSLEEDVLGSVARLQLHVAFGPAAVFLRDIYY